ncbi:Ku protein [Streptomyces sp. NPDC006463]|uniref:Ku protein n=1 Tax=Streptomyces sp. NPDC006463 TaxID=3364746 RepID=UPI00369370EE
MRPVPDRTNTPRRRPRPRGLTCRARQGTSDRIRNRRVKARTGDEVELDDIGEGYDTGDEYVLEPEELDEIAPGRSRSLEIAGFVNVGEGGPAATRLDSAVPTVRAVSRTGCAHRRPRGC